MISEVRVKILHTWVTSEGHWQLPRAGALCKDKVQHLPAVRTWLIVVRNAACVGNTAVP